MHALRIDALTVDHAPLLFEPLRDPALYTFIPDDPPVSLAALTARFRHLVGGPPGWRNWVMFADAVPVGTLQATVVERSADLAYAVFPPFWRRGHARAGVTAMIAALAVDRVAATIDTRNVASIRLVESLGFTRVATTLGADFFKGAPSDEHRYEREARL